MRKYLSAKFIGLRLVALAVSLGTLGSISVWAQVTITAGDMVISDANAMPGANGAVILINHSTGAQTIVSQSQFFHEPVGLAIEAAGTIVVADRGLGSGGVPSVIRVDPTRPSLSNQTVVWSGPPLVDPFGIALDGFGNIFVTDTGCPTHDCRTSHTNPANAGQTAATVYRLGTAGTAPTALSPTLTSGTNFLDRPYGIDVENAGLGDIVVTESISTVSPLTNGGIIRINSVTGLQSVVSVGNTSLGYGCPFGIAVDPLTANILNSVFTFDGYGCSPGAIFAANPAMDQSNVLSPHSIGWQAPFGMRVDMDGSILVVDESFKTVFRVNRTTGNAVPVGGCNFPAPGPATQCGFFVSPTDVAVYNASRLPRPSSSADLSLTKDGSANPVNNGAPLTYTLTVNNAGPDTAQSLIVTDTLPAGLTFVSANGSGWTCTQSGGTVTCTMPTLANGATSTITINVNAPSQPGTITNSASVTSSTNDPIPSNNTATATTTVVAPPAEWTGEGHIAVKGGIARFRFEVKRETTNGPVSGNLVFHNPVSKLKVEGISVTSLAVTGNSVVFTGTVRERTDDGQPQGPYSFTVTAQDNNDPAPGRGNDTFRIQIGDPQGTNEGGTLIKGKIEQENLGLSKLRGARRMLKKSTGT